MQTMQELKFFQWASNQCVWLLFFYLSVWASSFTMTQRYTPKGYFQDRKYLCGYPMVCTYTSMVCDFQTDLVQGKYLLYWSDNHNDVSKTLIEPLYKWEIQDEVIMYECSIEKRLLNYMANNQFITFHSF